MRPRIAHENRVLLLILAAAAPALAAAMTLLWLADFSPRVRWTVTAVIVLWLAAFAWSARERVMRPLQTLSNLIAALTEGDYSIRARRARTDEALGLAMWEVNQLTETLRAQRIGAVEATALLATVMEEIDVAILAFDDGGRLRLVNRAGARLLSRDGSDAIGEPAATLGLADTLAGDTPRLIEMPPRHGGGRWELRRTPFRQEGRSHELVVLSDLSRTLREEERQAWQRLVRVLSHEINNSLAPIRSVSESLISVVRRQARPAEWEDDLARGLEVIGRRAEALGRFMQSYARLARLPAPRRRPLDVSEWVRRVAKLETRRAVEVLPGPPIVISADGDQLDQLLINLITNAVDAAAETDGAVRVQWGTVNGFVEVRVEDEGPGLADTTNLFVPFFTTKPAGTGIGLALSRQIAEGHGGSLALANRPAGRGATATLRLPA